MIYWGKDKKLRRDTWTKVSVASTDYYKERFLWCKKYPSEGKFYRYYGVDSWWFENPQDATLFLLRWA